MAHREREREMMMTWVEMTANVRRGGISKSHKECLVVLAKKQQHTLTPTR